MLNILGRKYLTTKYVSKLIKYFKQSSSLLFFVRQLRDRVGTCQDNFCMNGPTYSNNKPVVKIENFFQILFFASQVSNIFLHI